MKKVFGIAAMLLALAACNKIETEIQTTDQAEGITITAQLAPKTGGATTRAVSDGGNKIESVWAENEHIAVLYEVSSTKYVADATITAVDGSGSATITFTVEAGTPNSTACTLVYPYTAAKDDHSGVKDAATLLAAQDGTLSANLDVRVGAGTIQTTTPGLTVTTQPEAQFAIFKFTTKNSDGSATIDVKPLTITIGSQDYVITPASATSELFVALPAVSSQAVTFTATGSDSKTYTASKASVSFDAGKYYQSTLKMQVPGPSYPVALSAVTSDYVGSVVTTDGNVYATVSDATAASKTAAAMIAYVSSTGHGLALALADDYGYQTWTDITSHSPAVTGGIWVLASETQWTQMITAMGSDDLRDGFSSVGGTNLVNGYYWSSTLSSSGGYRRYDFSDKDWYNSNLSSGKAYGRACLVF